MEKTHVFRSFQQVYFGQSKTSSFLLPNCKLEPHEPAETRKQSAHIRIVAGRQFSV